MGRIESVATSARSSAGVQPEWAGPTPSSDRAAEATALASQNEQLAETVLRLRREVRRLEELVYLDPLTGLANRRQCDAQLGAEIRRCARDELPLTLALCDVDCFKQYNDAYGHETGDRLLIDLAGLLRRHCRRGGDLAVRWAGDEFVLIWPGVSRPAGRRLADEVRIGAHALRIRHPHPRAPYRVTLSLGVTTFNGRSGCDAAHLLRTADRALYRAKRAGRDSAAFVAP